MNRKKMLAILLTVSFIVNLAILASPLVTTVSGAPKISAITWPAATKYADPSGDTQAWSTNMTIVGDHASHPKINTSETATGNLDAARDITQFWLGQDVGNDLLGFRIYVQDINSLNDIVYGAQFQIQCDYDTLGMDDCQLDGRTYVAMDALWERSILIGAGNTTADRDYRAPNPEGGVSDIRNTVVLSASVSNTQWKTIDDTNSTEHNLNHRTTGQQIRAVGNMTVSADYTSNYLEVTVPWVNFEYSDGSRPVDMRITVMSFKAGEWLLYEPFAPYRMAFDPQAPGNRTRDALGNIIGGREWKLGLKDFTWGPDAADVMPGNVAEIDWDDAHKTMNQDWDKNDNNTVDQWLDVPTGPHGPVAKYVYDPIVPREGKTVTFNGSSSRQGFTGTVYSPIATYEWDFGDGSAPAAGAVVTHPYTNAGYYNVTLTVTDGQPLSGKTWKMVAITNLSPGANWAADYTQKFIDPTGDTQSWSTNATHVATGNTSETGAQFDPARDLEEFWVTYDNETIYFRIYVNDLTNNDSLLKGAFYLIQISTTDGAGIREAQRLGDTFTSIAAAWERSIGVIMEPVKNNPPDLSAWMIDAAYNNIDDDNATKDPPRHPFVGNMTVSSDYTNNYLEISAPWEDFIDEATIAESAYPFQAYLMKMTVMSFKPGEWSVGDETLYDYRRAFEAQNPGTEDADGPDAADVMPGDQNEIDGTDESSAEVPQNTVDGWLDVYVGLASLADIGTSAVLLPWQIYYWPTKKYIAFNYACCAGPTPPPGRTLNKVIVTVTVVNYGTITKTFTVDAMNNSDVFQTKTVTNLVPFETRNVTFTFDQGKDQRSQQNGGLQITMSANTSAIAGDVDTNNNYETRGQDLIIQAPANTNNDNKVSIADVGPLVIAWKKKPGQANYDPRVDFNQDREIDTWDVSEIIFKWGDNAPFPCP